MLTFITLGKQRRESQLSVRLFCRLLLFSSLIFIIDCRVVVKDFFLLFSLNQRVCVSLPSSVSSVLQTSQLSPNQQMFHSRRLVAEPGFWPLALFLLCGLDGFLCLYLEHMRKRRTERKKKKKDQLEFTLCNICSEGANSKAETQKTSG